MKLNILLSIMTLSTVFVAGNVNAQERQQPNIVLDVATADLTVIPAQTESAIEGIPGTGYCNFNNYEPSDKILFRIVNNGFANTGPFTMHIGFKPHNAPIISVLMDIQNVAPGSSSLRSVDIPDSIGDASPTVFNLFADSTDQVSELVETNNHDSGYCLHEEG
jgi:hypothetical protein